MSRCDGMGDMEVLEASAERRAGSNPVIGIWQDMAVPANDDMSILHFLMTES